MLGKSRIAAFLEWFVGRVGQKSKLAKEGKYQTSYADVARSTFLRGGAVFKFKCWKIARCCGAKHIWESKCTKHRRFGPLFEVQMSKNCTPLWRQAHFKVKLLNKGRSWTIFGSSNVAKIVRRCGAKHISQGRSSFQVCSPSMAKDPSILAYRNFRGLPHFIGSCCSPEDGTPLASPIAMPSKCPCHHRRTCITSHPMLPLCFSTCILQKNATWKWSPVLIYCSEDLFLWFGGIPLSQEKVVPNALLIFK